MSSDNTKCLWEINKEEDIPTDFGSEFLKKTGIIYAIAIALFLPCLAGKNLCLMLNPVMLWIPAITYMICNWIAYFHDPSRYVFKYKCLFGYLKCHHFSLLTGIFAFLFDMWTFYSLMGNLKPAIKLVAILPMALLGISAIIYSFIKTKEIKEDEKDFKAPKQPDPIGNWTSFIERDGRVTLYGIIMFFGVVMALQAIFSGIFSTAKSSVIFKVFEYIGILLGLGADAIAFKFQVEYRAKDYCLPDEFK